MTRSRLRDVGEGLGGALGMALNLVTPFLRPLRAHWGLARADADVRTPAMR